jgi:membrane protein DedA with SNARE-associated domain
MQEMRDLLAQHGMALVFANVLLTQLGLPLPAVPLLIVAGALAAAGKLSFVAVVLVAVAASLLGDLPWYFAGRRYGYRILRTVCRIAIEPDSCVKQTEDIFDRWGPPSLLVAKFIPGFSTVAPPLAGAVKLALGRFLAFSATGAVLWAMVPVAVGALFSNQVEEALAWVERTGTRALVVVVGLVAAYLAIKLVQRQLLIKRLRSVRLDAAELLAMIGAGKPLVVLDARSQTARKVDPRHIPGAIAINLANVENALGPEQLDHDIVVYCS